MGGVIFGEWEVRESWHFKVDNQKGGKFSVVEDCITHQELVRMIHDDYNLNNQIDLLELGYSLPSPILCHMPQDTLPMLVTNDSQVHSFIELCKSHVLRLCVSYKRVFKKVDEDIDGDDDDYANSGSETNDDGDHEHEYDDYANDGVYSDEEEYGSYGKVEDEDEDEDDDEDDDLTVFDRTEKGFTILCEDKIYVNQSFNNKNELVLELRKLSITKHFAFKVDMSMPNLFVAVCRVYGCKWRLRATTISKEYRSLRRFIPASMCCIRMRQRHSVNIL